MSKNKKKRKEKKVSQRQALRKPAFPPKFSTEGIQITGFTVQIWDYQAPVYEEDNKSKQ
jgi:hypothetical protein